MCGKSIFKYTLIAFNVIFVLVGAVTLGLGIFVKYKQDDIAGLISEAPVGEANEVVDLAELLVSSAYVLIACGGFMFLVGFLGCCGAWKELRIFLVIYAILLGLLLVMEVAAIIAAVMFKDEVDELLLEALTKSLDEKYLDGAKFENDELKLSSDIISMTWDLAQFGMECCGASNFTDYEYALNWDNTYTYSGMSIDAVVPVSCCKVTDPSVFPDNLQDLKFEDIQGCLSEPSAANTNMDGCYDTLETQIKNYAKMCSIVGIVIIGVEIVGILFACYLCKTIGKEDQYV